jgi:RNA polymerase sigma-70 factor (ECF subfamily)
VEAPKVAERVARDSYGRLVALLSARSRDIAGAEDALGEAFVAALATWPIRGVPANPDGWLLTAARNRLLNAARHQRVRDLASVDLLTLASATDDTRSAFPDERLKLMFVCAHPAIDVSVRAPLMLQTILGLDAERIAGAFLVAPATMGQRLVRAKVKIRAAGIRFEAPDPADLTGRLSEVLDAVYAAYGVGWDGLHDLRMDSRDLTEEAIHLGRLLVALLPDQPEPKGLLALMLYCEARRPARHGSDGSFVPLDRQDARLWSREMIIEAEGLLTTASRFQQFGRYQCEAAIQSVHIQRPIIGKTNHEALLTLYGMLVAASPSTGALVGLASVLVEVGWASEALDLLDSIPQAAGVAYQPYWVVRVRTLSSLGRSADAEMALARALELTEAEPVRIFLYTLLR